MAFVTKSYNFSSKYLLKKAFTNILIQKKFIRFTKLILKVYKFGDLTQEHPVYMKSTEHILDYISNCKDFRDAIIDCDHYNTDLSNVDTLTVNSFINDLSHPLDKKPVTCWMKLTSAINSSS